MKSILFRCCLVAIALFIGFALIATETQAQATKLDAPPTPSPVIGNVEEVYLPIIVRHSEGDDCSAIQAAIDGLPDTGGQVLISTGIFECNTALVVDKNNVDVRGQGPATILYLADGADSPVVVIGDISTPIEENYAHIRLSNIAIDGNKAGQTVECWGGPCDTGGLTFIRNNGITIRGAADVEIENVVVFRARSGGLVTEKGCRRVTVQGFTTSENFFDGIAAYETENSLFTGLHLADNGYAGMSLDIRFNHNVVSDAIFTDNGKQGIFMRDSRNNLFSSIQVRNSGEQGLFLAQADLDPNTAAEGNTFEGLVVSNSAQAGMRINDSTCIDNLVVAAQFVDNAECVSAEQPELVEQIGVICR